jgi:hypothetical protein
VTAEYAAQGNHLGSSASVAQVVLAIDMPSTLSIVENGDGTVTVTFAGTPTAKYIVQTCNSLVAPVWVNVSTNSAGADGRWTFTESKEGNPVRFYRSAK